MQHFRNVLNCTRGGLTTVAAVSAFGLVIAAGCGIDYVRWQRAQSELQEVVDSAGTAAAAGGKADLAALKTTVKDYVKANLHDIEIVNVSDPDVTYDADLAQVGVAVTGDISMNFLSLAGFYTMPLAASTLVQQARVPPLEVALVLDTTYSMVGTKVTALKTAAANLTKTLMANPKVKVGVVPFANYVNIGIARRNKPWANVAADTSKKVDSCSTSYPDKTGCTTKTTTGTCTSTKDGISSSYACSSSVETCTDWGKAKTVCNKVDSWTKFYGCVGSRVENKRDTVSDPSKTYPGIMNTYCAAEILDLTGNQGQVLSKINTMGVDGETYLPAGITWGWNMLTPDEPLTNALSAADLKAKGGRKVMVVMTDGVSTLAPYDEKETYHTVLASTKYKGTDYANALSAQLCANAKADGIDIYTVLFDVKDAAIEAMLQNCASDASKSYVAADAAQLLAAFADIATKLAQVRIVK